MGDMVEQRKNLMEYIEKSKTEYNNLVAQDVEDQVPYLLPDP